MSNYTSSFNTPPPPTTSNCESSFASLETLNHTFKNAFQKAVTTASDIAAFIQSNHRHVIALPNAIAGLDFAYIALHTLDKNKKLESRTADLAQSGIVSLGNTRDNQFLKKLLILLTRDKQNPELAKLYLFVQKATSNSLNYSSLSDVENLGKNGRWGQFTKIKKPYEPKLSTTSLSKTPSNDEKPSEEAKPTEQVKTSEKTDESSSDSDKKPPMLRLEDKILPSEAVDILLRCIPDDADEKIFIPEGCPDSMEKAIDPMHKAALLELQQPYVKDVIRKLLVYKNSLRSSFYPNLVKYPLWRLKGFSEFVQNYQQIRQDLFNFKITRTEAVQNILHLIESTLRDDNDEADDADLDLLLQAKSYYANYLSSVNQAREILVKLNQRALDFCRHSQYTYIDKLSLNNIEYLPNFLQKDMVVVNEVVNRGQLYYFANYYPQSFSPRDEKSFRRSPANYSKNADDIWKQAIENNALVLFYAKDKELGMVVDDKNPVIFIHGVEDHAYEAFNSEEVKLNTGKSNKSAFRPIKSPFKKDFEDKFVEQPLADSDKRQKTSEAVLEFKSRKKEFAKLERAIAALQRTSDTQLEADMQKATLSSLKEYYGASYSSDFALTKEQEDAYMQMAIANSFADFYKPVAPSCPPPPPVKLEPDVKNTENNTDELDEDAELKMAIELSLMPNKPEDEEPTSQSCPPPPPVKLKPDVKNTENNTDELDEDAELKMAIELSLMPNKPEDEEPTSQSCPPPASKKPKLDLERAKNGDDDDDE